MTPHGASVVDAGCGDGLIGSLVRRQRPDLEVSGIDIAVRAGTHIPVQAFDGLSIPFANRSVDVVMLVDVLHHAEDPMRLLGEAARVARQAVVLKDVTPLGPGSHVTLRFMDWVGNARHGVPLPYDFWTQEQWKAAFRTLGLGVEEVRRRLALYPFPANLLFEKRMHFILRLSRR
jgi:SAM-dependent methyltransferase